MRACAALSLGDGNELRLATRVGEDAIAHQAVVDDNVSRLEGTHSLQRHQLGIAWPSADEDHATLTRLVTGLSHQVIRACATRRFVSAKDGSAGSSTEEGLPECTARCSAGQVRSNPIAVLTRDVRQPPEAWMEVLLKIGPQARRQHRSRALGADGHRDGAPVDDGGQCERAEMWAVGHVDGHAYGARARRNVAIDRIVCRRRDDQRSSAKVLISDVAG